MLGRTADSLYWMARYTERAENIARLLDVGYRMGLLAGDGPSQQSVWASSLEVSGTQFSYAEKYDEVTRDDVIRHLAIDRENLSSIVSCIYAARENARALRGSITTEMWEALNATWLELRDIDENTLRLRGYRDLFDWVKERTNLFRGVTEGTMLQDDGYAFMRLGWYLERANNTARLLDSKYHVLLDSASDVGGAVDYYQWGALLRSVSAFRAYHRVYSNVIVPMRVAELLIMRDDMPRSLHACLNRINDAFDQLCDRRPYECRRIAGELHARLEYGTIRQVLDRGLHEFLTEFVDRTNDLGGQIQRDFMMLA
jgi:uncharacterized alpha-E superfamily protein